MKQTKFGKGGITTAEGKATGKEARVNARMAEMDKYLKDPSKRLIRTASGKFQFVDAKPTAKSAAVPTKKSTDNPNAVPGSAQKKPSIGGGSIPTPKSPNAVPGRDQKKPRIGGGSIPTPSLRPSRGRVGAGALGRGGKDPEGPRDMTGVNQTPISGTDIAKSLAKGAASGLAAATPLGRFRKAATAAKAGPKLLPAPVKRLTGPSEMKSLPAPAKRLPAPPKPKGKTKSSAARKKADNKTREEVKKGFEKRFKDLKIKKRVAEARSDLKEKKLTAGEASDKALGFRRGGKL